MARRVVTECDLSKAEYDPAETVTLVIKKNGKKTGRTYELSPQAAAKLEQQLVSGSKLPEEWFFAGVNVRSSRSNMTTNEDLEPTTLASEEQSDEQIIAAKHAAREEVEEDVEPDSTPAIDPSICPHRNRSRTHMKMKNGERFAYKICKDCRKMVEVHKRDERLDYANGKVPSDINLKDREK